MKMRTERYGLNLINSFFYRKVRVSFYIYYFVTVPRNFVSIFYEYESFQSAIKEWNFKQADVEFVSSVHFH